MHPVVQMMLFQTLTVPLDPSDFPTGYEYHHGSTLVYTVEYRWQDARTVVAANRPVEGTERQMVLTLGEDSRLLRESSKRGDTLTVAVEYGYADGKLLTVRSPRTLRTYHYLGDRLDSIAETSGDILEEYYKYAYDSQGRLSQTDHYYDRDGVSFTMHRRRRIAYFLPDSIVINGAYPRDPGDSSRATLHLSGDRPIRMVEVDYSAFGDDSATTHTWRYPGLASIKGKGIRQSRLRFRPEVSGPVDLLGRTNEARKRPKTPKQMCTQLIHKPFGKTYTDRNEPEGL